MCHSAVPCLCTTLGAYLSGPPNVFDATVEYVRRSLISTYRGIHCHPRASYDTPMYRSFTRMALYRHSLTSCVHKVVHNTTTTSHSHIPDQELTTIFHLREDTPRGRG